jgi:hypothetical protein
VAYRDNDNDVSQQLKRRIAATEVAYRDNDNGVLQQR